MIVSGVPGNVDEVWPGHYCKGTSKYYVITFRDILPPHPQGHNIAPINRGNPGY